MNSNKTFYAFSCLTICSFVADGGIYTSAICMAILMAINLYTTWLLIKARNRFKHREIVSLGDLCEMLFGGWSVVFITFTQLSGCIVSMLGYQMFFGATID